jgi:son of sevenless-like protein
VSGSKKKLAKWLGEEEVSEILDPSQMRPPVEENPSYLAVDYSDDDVILYMDGSVKAGTLQALVERLTLHDRTGKSRWLR